MRASTELPGPSKVLEYSPAILGHWEYEVQSSHLDGGLFHTVDVRLSFEYLSLAPPGVDVGMWRSVPS